MPPKPKHARGSATSEAAAAKLKTQLKDARLILDFLERVGDYGATCDEAEVELNLIHASCSARFTDLRKYSGVCELSGVQRPTRTGSTAEVYRLPAGVSAEAAYTGFLAWRDDRSPGEPRTTIGERALIDAGRLYAEAVQSGSPKAIQKCADVVLQMAKKLRISYL